MRVQEHQKRNGLHVGVGELGGCLLGRVLTAVGLGSEFGAVVDGFALGVRVGVADWVALGVADGEASVVWFALVPAPPAAELPADWLALELAAEAPCVAACAGPWPPGMIARSTPASTITGNAIAPNSRRPGFPPSRSPAACWRRTGIGLSS